MLWLAVQLGLVDEAEDPREALDLAYARQIELQAAARRAVLDVVTARKRIELRSRHLGPTVVRLEERARAALEEGRQDAARVAVTRRTALAAELDALDGQAAALAGEESRLREVAGQVDVQLERLRLRREALRASHAAARARAELARLLDEARASEAEGRLALREAEQRVVGARALEAAPMPDELIRMEEELLWGPEDTLPPGGGGQGGGDK